MVCVQLKVYIAYIVLQNLIGLAILGGAGLRILGPLLFSGLIYLLCSYKHFKVANVLVGITLVFGVLADLYAFTHVAQVKKVAKSSEKGGHRLGPGGEQHGGHRLGPGGEQQ